jgi:PTH1 family peptidyl-tRNA hydrolase
MALFQRQPQSGDSIQYYTLSQNKIILIVGLGNVGSDYNNTRHNVGFEVVDNFVKSHDFPGWIERKDLKCHFVNGQMGESKVIVIKPTTLMNLSGEAVQAVSHFYKVNLDYTVVVHDELDIPFGQIRARISGSSAGHNGIKSITEQIGEGYGRLRIGIGPKTDEHMDSADFVLGKFSSEQQAQIKDLTREASVMLSEFVYGGKLVAETRSFIF